MIRRALHKWFSRSSKIVLLTLLIQICPQPATCNDEPKKSEKEVEAVDHDMIQALLVQIQALQSRVKELELKQTITISTINPELLAGASSSSVISTVTPVITTELPAAAAAPQDLSVGPLEGIKLRLLGDVGYHASDLHGDHKPFYIGSAEC
jgi:hypothetical protein